MSKYGDHNFFCLCIWFCELAEKLSFSRWFWIFVFFIVHCFLLKPQKHSVCSERMVCSYSSILQSSTCTIPYFSLEGNELLGKVLVSWTCILLLGNSRRSENFPLFCLSYLQPGHAHSLGVIQGPSPFLLLLFFFFSIFSKNLTFLLVSSLDGC